ncbi:MAG: alpha/beta hydrolase [Rhizobiaceae bacterium]|nr:alpha/beta hydrolase [Rhizobiaceae bacterium]
MAEYHDHFYQSEDGLQLHARIYEAAGSSALSVVCLPGLTRNARDFHDLAIFLSSSAKPGRRVVVFEYRGRGQSQWDADSTHYNVATEAKDVLVGLDGLAIPRAAFIGTSRGGLIIHVLAALRPDILGPIVLNDIGPVIEPEGLVQIRDYLSTAPRPGSFNEAETVQRKIHGAAFPSLSDEDWRRFVRAIYRDDAGRPVPDFDSALINGLWAFDPAKPMPDLWAQFDLLAAKPLLTIRGTNSRLLSQATVEEMARRHPGMEIELVAGQGHAPLLETADLPARITKFLTRKS